jgi:LysM repeat protein
MLAPVALVAFALVFLLIVAGSLSGGGEGPARIKEGVSDKQRQQDFDQLGDGGDPTAPTSTPVNPSKSSYRVKPGDTLEAIALDTGVPVDQIRELNPNVDPQALIAGTKLRLQE